MKTENKNVVILSIKDYNELKNKERVHEEEKESLENRLNEYRRDFKKNLKKELDKLIETGEVYDVDLDFPYISRVSRLAYIAKSRDEVICKVLDKLGITDIVFENNGTNARKMTIKGVEWFSCELDREIQKRYLEGYIKELEKKESALNFQFQNSRVKRMRF